LCSCIDLTNKALEDRGVEVSALLFLDGRKPRVAVTTTKKNPKSRVKPPFITPNYCPFCGEKYEDPAEPSPEAVGKGAGDPASEAAEG
jgi:hypothetical protein